MPSERTRPPGMYRFGEGFELDPQNFELRRSGQVLKLERIPFGVLLLLIERNGQVVTREQIIERIWSKTPFLDTDNSINGAIRKIRQVLKDDPEQPRFIQTVVGRGYRFSAAVVGPSVENPEPAQTPLTSSSLIGQRIADYRILKLLGGGGMGVVYQAEDLKLGRSVAMKFLPEELSSDPAAFERLAREARAASAIDHPNICAVYQLGEHEGHPYIVMPLLEGETLRDWIQKRRPESGTAPLIQTIELAIQIADALRAAHAKGVIHRDIKPTNIFVTPQGQIKVLDFGIAEYVDAAHATDTSEANETTGINTSAIPSAERTETSSLGTPSYCSPEQVRREKLDVRTDLFSFGLVLYEMVTGRRAFPGMDSAEVRDKIVNQLATPIRQLDKTLPAEIERIISLALEKNPLQRYQTAEELRTDLVRLRPRLGSSWWQSRQARAVAAVLLLVIALSAGAFFIRGPIRAAQQPGGRVRIRRSVAVLGFRNLSGKSEEDWISAALAEMLRTELASGERLRVVSGENIALMKLDLSLPSTDSYSAQTLSTIRNRLRADDVIIGSFLASGEAPNRTIRLDLRVQDASNGEIVAGLTESGREAEVADVVARAGLGLRDKLGIGVADATDSRSAKAVLPANQEALRLYALGLEKLRIFDAVAARQLLEKAVAADSNHALSHAALAQSLYSLGYEAKAQAEAKQAFDLSHNLPRHEELLVEGRYHEILSDYPAAIDVYRTLWKFFPDDVGAGLRLANVQIRAGLGKDALVTVAQMRNLPAPANKNPRIELAEAEARQSLGDFKGCQQAAAMAVEEAQQEGSRLVLADAKGKEAWAWDRLGQMDRAASEYAESRDLALQGGNPRAAARALDGIAQVFYDKGDFEGAGKLYEEALKIARRTGANKDIGIFGSNLGNVFYEQGKLAEARQYYEGSLSIDRELGIERSIASDLGNIANVLESMGDLSGALNMHERSLQAFRNSGDRRGEASTLNNLGNVLASQGQLESAKSKFEEAMVVQQQIGYRRGRGFSLFGISNILQEQDRLAEARVKIEEAIALRKEIGDTTNLAYSQMQLAEVSLEQGNATEAESLARQAAAAFDEQKVFDQSCKAEAILSRAFLSQAKVPQAQTAADRALKLCQQGSDREARLESLLAAAAVDTQTGKYADALKLAESARVEAKRFGYVAYDFASRLQIALLEIKSGKTLAGRNRLAQLQSEAAVRGYALIARKAALTRS